MQVTKSNLTALLKKAARAETSANPKTWSEGNPLWGHCAVASLIAQEYFGGELLRGSLEHIPRYKEVRSHYWNRIENTEVDFTKEQFLDVSFKELKGEERNRKSILAHPSAAQRYTLLKERLEALTHE